MRLDIILLLAAFSNAAVALFELYSGSYRVAFYAALAAIFAFTTYASWTKEISPHYRKVQKSLHQLKKNFESQK